MQEAWRAAWSRRGRSCTQVQRAPESRIEPHRLLLLAPRKDAGEELYRRLHHRHQGLRPVKQRPGMRNPAPRTRCVIEVIDNAADRAMAGFCRKDHTVTLPRRLGVSVADDGRGIPVEIHPVGACRRGGVLRLHAGGRVQPRPTGTRPISQAAWWRGPVTNACPAWRSEVVRDGAASGWCSRAAT